MSLNVAFDVSAILTTFTLIIMVGICFDFFCFLMTLDTAMIENVLEVFVAGKAVARSIAFRTVVHKILFDFIIIL